MFSEITCQVVRSFQPKWIFVSVSLAGAGALWGSDPKLLSPFLLVQGSARRQGT